jgi:hypothetical protein
MERLSNAKSEKLVPLGEKEDPPDAEASNCWDSAETVPIRAGHESRQVIERAERLRLVTRRRWLEQR